MGKWLYWLLVAALVGFGWVAILSVGAPFLLIGAALAILWPYRRRAQVYWPALLGAVGFIAGYFVVAPIGCVSGMYAATTPEGSTTRATEEALTECVSVVGITYTGGASYSPPFWPGLLAAVALALVAVFASRFLLARRSKGRLPATSL